MRSDGTKVGLWQPVTGGRHAFDLEARCSDPGGTALAVCGAEVSTDELQRVADDMAWISGGTCMECWEVLASRE